MKCRMEDGKEVERYHLMLYKEDFELIKAHFGENPGTSRIIRAIIHKAVKSIREKSLASARQVPLEDIEVDTI